MIRSKASTKCCAFLLSIGSFHSNRQCSGRISEEDKDSSLYFHDFYDYNMILNVLSLSTLNNSILKDVSDKFVY